MDALTEINAVAEQARLDLAKVSTVAELEDFRIRYLSANGRIKQLMKLLASVPKEQKPTVGQHANQVSRSITEQFEKVKEQLGSKPAARGLDVTEPGQIPAIGNKHILMKTIDELVELFGRMGFAVASGPEVEDEFHNFIALNIPEQHPARDPLDNFYLHQGDREKGSAARKKEANQLLLRTQTSTVQIRVMENQKPPIRVVIPGKVYRPDTHDDTHLSMFHQLEALVVDNHVTMVDLKSTILQFAHAYFGSDTKVRFRPSFFPFTEPSAEIDIWFPEKNRWIESGGCGMVHPDVLKSVKIDSEKYSGWAFGFGIERIAMRKYGINNIRLFVENDLRFLRQF